MLLWSTLYYHDVVMVHPSQPIMIPRNITATSRLGVAITLQVTWFTSLNTQKTNPVQITSDILRLGGDIR